MVKHFVHNLAKFHWIVITNLHKHTYTENHSQWHILHYHTASNRGPPIWSFHMLKYVPSKYVHTSLATAAGPFLADLWESCSSSAQVTSWVELSWVTTRKTYLIFQVQVDADTKSMVLVEMAVYIFVRKRQREITYVSLIVFFFHFVFD